MNSEQTHPLCDIYGHNWSYDMYKSQQAPAGYYVESCSRSGCEKERLVQDRVI